jgi:glycosyltransferase involved in cell wall biosynthesis
VLIDWSGYYIYQQHPVLHQSKRTVLAMLRVFQLDEFEYAAVHGVDQVVVLGKYDEQSVLSRYKAPREKVAVYYPPVRSDLFRYAHCDAFSKNVVQPQRYLLCVSRISPEKDTHAFVALVRSLQKKGVLEKHQLTPLICGSIQDADYYEKYFKVAMEQDKLILHENVSDVHRLAEIYAQSAVLVHPARTDAFGMCICEAACFDVPCVVSGCGVGAVEAFPPNHPLLYLVDWSDADAVERQVMLAIEHSSSSSSANPVASSLPYRDTAITESRFATGILGL